MIGHHLSAALPELQAQAESMQITPCRVRRPTGVQPDPVTGADVPTYQGQPVHAGTCKVKDQQTVPLTTESGTASTTVQRLEVHLPVASGPYKIGDVVEILDRPADQPSTQVIRRLRMTGCHLATWQTAQRIPVEEVT